MNASNKPEDTSDPSPEERQAAGRRMGHFRQMKAVSAHRPVLPNNNHICFVRDAVVERVTREMYPLSNHRTRPRIDLKIRGRPSRGKCREMSVGHRRMNVYPVSRQARTFPRFAASPTVMNTLRWNELDRFDDFVKELWLRVATICSTLHARLCLECTNFRGSPWQIQCAWFLCLRRTVMIFKCFSKQSLVFLVIREERQSVRRCLLRATGTN